MLHDSNQTQATRRIAWLTEPNNKIFYEYYNGIFDGHVDDGFANPSGARNLKYEIYKDGRDREIFRILYKWNIENTIVSEHCLKF